MNKCKYCGKEQDEEWLQLAEIGIEVQSKVHDHGTPFNKIVIPKGCRLPSLCREKDFVNEVALIINKFSEQLNLKSGDNDFWIEQWIEEKKGKYATGLYYSYGEFRVDGYDDLHYGGRSRGVLLIRDIK